MHPAFVARSKTAQPIWFVTPRLSPKSSPSSTSAHRAFVKAAGFEPRPGRHLILPSASGTGGVLFGIESATKRDKNAFLPGLLPGVLPAGTYRFANAPHDARLAALAFALGTYRFTRYRKAEGQGGASSCCPTASTATSSTPHRRRRDAGARPDQHAGQRHGAGRARSRGAQRWPSSTARNSARSSATICSSRTFR